MLSAAAPNLFQRIIQAASQDSYPKQTAPSPSIARPLREPLPNFKSYGDWLKAVSPELSWDWDHLVHIREQLADVTLGVIDRLAISVPPQHGKSQIGAVRYPLWRMLREPGLRVGVASYNQRYANKLSRWTRRIGRRIGEESKAKDTKDASDEWELGNGSTFIARGVGGGIAGEPLDLLVIDDPFKSREEADSPVTQETVYEWYMDDVTPRIQERGAIVIIHTRWNPGDLIGRIQESEEGSEWKYVRLPALAEKDDPLKRELDAPLCPQRFSKEKLLQKRRIEGIGFESLYQQNPIVRGGTFFRREWFEVLDRLPSGTPIRRVRYWDLANSRKDSACYTSGVLMAKIGDIVYVEDVIRGRWSPAERNEEMRKTAMGDATKAGFERTFFESPVFDTGKEARRAVIAKLAGFPVRADEVSGSKEIRAEPLSDAARGGLVKIIAGSWHAAYLTELEGFPKVQYKDQVDSSSGAYNMLAKREATFSTLVL